MKTMRSDSLKTRIRLLEAASEVFAEKGFRNATHEEISHKANANVASINYHFGSKENFYVEAWKYSFEKSNKKHPPGGYALPDDPVEKRIRGRILSILERIIDPETHDIDIMHKEVSNPTGLLTEVFSKTVEPLDNDLKSLIKEYLGKGAGEEEINFCCQSIFGQCFTPLLHLRYKKRGSPMLRSSLNMLEMGVEKLADYITKFIFHGMDSFRRTSH
jgi:TetR/AcrR family transcriptional regulator, regulator of cefoperazone and chloramphenicol sensitivity